MTFAEDIKLKLFSAELNKETDTSFNDSVRAEGNAYNPSEDPLMRACGELYRAYVWQTWEEIANADYSDPNKSEGRDCYGIYIPPRLLCAKQPLTR